MTAKSTGRDESCDTDHTRTHYECKGEAGESFGGSLEPTSWFARKGITLASTGHCIDRRRTQQCIRDTEVSQGGTEGRSGRRQRTEVA
jgi:hypothetical protein